MPGIVPANTNFVTPLAAGGTLTVKGSGTYQPVPTQPASIADTAEPVLAPFSTIGPFGKNVNVFLAAGAQPISFQASPPKSAGIRFFELDLSENKDDAALNVAMIQSALDCGGYVVVLKTGTFWINDTLVMRSGTYFYTAPGADITMLSGINKKMLINAAAVNAIAGVRTTVTLAWTSGPICTVTWTAHRKTPNDYVCLQYATPLASQRAFVGVFRIHKVVDANTFQVRLFRIPTAAPTGTVYGYTLDKDITLDCQGFWDYNWNGVLGSSPNTDTATNRHAVIMAGVAGLKVRAINTRNADKFGFHTCGIIDSTVENVTSFNVAECYKQYGPMANTHVRGIRSYAFDDCSTIQCQEPAAFINYMIFQGPIDQHTVEDVNVGTNAAAGSMAVGLYTDDTYIPTGIKWKNICAYSENGAGFKVQPGSGFASGFTAWSSVTAYVVGNKVSLNGENYICVQAHTSQTPPDSIYWVVAGKGGNLSLEGYNGAGKAGTAYGISIVSIVDNFATLNPEPQWEDTAGTNLIRQESTSTIRTLVIDGYRHTGASHPNTTTAYAVNLNGNIDTVRFRNCYIQMNATFGRFLTVGANAVRAIVFENCVFTSAALIAIFQAGATVARDVTCIGCYFDNIGNASNGGFECRSLTRFNFINCIAGTINGGLVRTTTTAGVMAKVHGSGNDFGSAVVIVNTGSSTAEVYSFDVPIDATATGFSKTTAGQYARLSALAGTIPANRLALCDGTNWRCADDRTLLF